MPWIAVDFDGTLAQGHDLYKPGPPVEKMLERVKAWLAEGKDVRIFTARVGEVSRSEALEALSGVKISDVPSTSLDKPVPEVWQDYQRHLLNMWCLTHLGRALPITASKDLHCIQIWDDISMQVATNEGYTVQDVALEYSGKIHFLLTQHGLYGPEGYTFPDGDHWAPDPEEPV